jgi:hypothetical protein
MPFLDGWLDAAPPTMTFIDGDERGYRYNDPADYLAAAVQIKGEFAWHVSPENRGKYRSQVRVSSGLYLDAYVNPPTSGWYIDPRGRPRVQRLAENAASALQAADDYVWIYGEKGRWWPNDKSSHKPWPEILPGCDLALASARDPVGTALAQVEAQRKAGQVRDLARNGAFRSGPADASGKGPPSEWTSWQAEGSHGQFDWERGDGQGAARLTAVRDGCLLQSFPATPGQRYLVTARVRSTGPAEPCIRIRWQTGDGGWTTPSRDVVFHAPAESPRDWGTISGVATVPEAAGRLVILLGVSGAGAVDESAWFDDVHAFLLP